MSGTVLGEVLAQGRRGRVRRRLVGVAPVEHLGAERESAAGVLERSRAERRRAARYPGRERAAGEQRRAGDEDDDGRGVTPRQRRHHRSSRCSRARIADSSAGSAWSQPQTWSVPWVTRSRSSSRASQRTSPVWPPRPASACSTARSTDTITSPRCGRASGGSAKRDAAVRRADAGRLPQVRRVRRRRQQREREHVGRAVLAHVRGVEGGELGVVGEDQADGRGPGGAGGVEGRGDRPRQHRGRQQPRDVVAPLHVDPPRTEVEAAHRATQRKPMWLVPVSTASPWRAAGRYRRQ